MHRKTTASAAAAAALAISLLGVTAAADAGAATTAKLNKSDAAFLKSNDQVNLAEITLGNYIHGRTHNGYAYGLSRVTVRDHKKAEKAVKALAKADHVSLPSKPNAMQRAAAAQVHAARSFNGKYFKVQVAGHELSIKQTEAEIKNGSNTAVVDYAKAYLPVAQMHLKMAKKDLARWNRNH